MRKVRIRDILTRKKEVVIVEDGKYYKRVTIKTKGQGVFLRDIEKGENIGTKSQFLTRKGHFLLSKIDARNGAFGIVGDDLDGAIITGNFWTFEVNQDELNIEWFNLFVSSQEFIKICENASSGTTNRKYLDEDKFLNYELLLPSKEEQDDIISRYRKQKLYLDSLVKEITYQEKTLDQLKNQILLEAVQGKLVEQDPNDEPAAELLKRIREEKERLIKEKKIKKEKPLPPISPEEIPYELPKGWEWVRLGELVSKLGAGKTPKGGDTNYQSSGIKFIRSQNVWNDGLVLDDIAYISEEINETMRGSIVHPEDILLNITGASIGRSCLLPDDFDTGNVNQHVAIIRLIKPELRFYIHKCIISPLFQNRIMDVQVGISREGLSMSKLAHFIVPLPPMNEQKRIIEKIDTLFKICKSLEISIKKAQKDVQLLLQKTLQELI